MSKRKQIKTTNFAWGAAISVVCDVAKSITGYAGAAAKGIVDTGMITLAYAAVVLGFVAPVIWAGTKYLSKTGFNALNNLLISLWRSAHLKKVNTDDAKELLRDMKRKILTKNPKLKDDPIMYDIKELNKLCYYIDNMSTEGMTKLEYEDAQWKLTNDIKVLLIEFGKVMNKA